jgi:hypothetical protein
MTPLPPCTRSVPPVPAFVSRKGFPRRQTRLVRRSGTVSRPGCLSLLSSQNGEGSFQWKDYRHSGKSRIMTVTAGEFIRRFLIHTLPPGFPRIPCFASGQAHRKDKLALCRRLLTNPVAELLPQPADCQRAVQSFIALPVSRCPCCETGTMIGIGIVPAYRWPAKPPDSS